MNIYHKKSLLIFMLYFLLSPPAYSQDNITPYTANKQQPNTLCTTGEQSIFTCFTGKKTASLCIKESRNDLFAQYRYGTSKKLDLAYPETQRNSSGKFMLSTTPYPGGGANRIRFVNGGYNYFMYDITKPKVDSDGQSYPIFMSGILVRKNGRNIASLYCDNEDAGISSIAFDIFNEESFDRNIDMSGTALPGHSP